MSEKKQAKIKENEYKYYEDLKKNAPQKFINHSRELIIKKYIKQIKLIF